MDRTILRLAVPALGTLAIEPLYVVTDTAIVGHLGTTALGGLAIAGQVLILVIGCCNFLAYGTTQRLAHHRGAGRHGEAALVGVQALWLSVLIGVPLAIATAAFAEPVARALGGEGPTLDAAVTYLRISAVALPCVLVALVGHGVLRATRDLRVILRIVAVASVGNLLLEIVAVYVLDMGIAGSAWSTVVVQVVAAIAYLRALRPVIAASPTWTIVPAEIVAMLRVGGLLLLRVGALLTTFTVATAVAARVDAATLGAHQIVVTTFFLVALVLDALAIPAQSLVAEALGANDIALARLVGSRVLALSLRFGVGLAAAARRAQPAVAAGVLERRRGDRPGHGRPPRARRHARAGSGGLRPRRCAHRRGGVPVPEHLDGGRAGGVPPCARAPRAIIRSRHRRDLDRHRGLDGGPRRGLRCGGGAACCPCTPSR